LKSCPPAHCRFVLAYERSALQPVGRARPGLVAQGRRRWPVTVVHGRARDRIEDSPRSVLSPSRSNSQKLILALAIDAEPTSPLPFSVVRTSVSPSTSGL
jgi:hypothetical protein